MLPASNKGVGMNMGFPDVCLTPAGPAAVPVPYPNMAMNAMAAPFCPTILLSCMPALNQGSIVPMTLGMQPGVANPLYMQMGMYTMGNPKVILQCLPAINLTCPTTGNGMNNALGAVLVPSVTNVFFADASATASGPVAADLRSSLASTLVAPGVAHVRIRRFAADVPSAFFHAMASLGARGAAAVVVDVRGNPGGEVAAFVELAGDFLAEGALVATLVDVDGDEIPYFAQRARMYDVPVVVLVDEATASAAELFAACLGAHDRATLVGVRTYGKGAAQALVASPAGASRYGDVATVVLPDGSRVDGAGVEPHLVPPRVDVGAWVEAASQRMPRELAVAAARAWEEPLT